MAPSDHSRPAGALKAPRASPPGVDRAELARFVEALFRHAKEGGTVALRAFYDDALARKRNDPPFKRYAVKINGSGLGCVIDIAFKLATEAAQARRPVVVCPPIATFTSGRAREDDLLEGLVLSVELDERPSEALATLRALLGPPTLVVASGGEWTDPATGEIHPKLHVHWRLKEPTQTPEEHRLLKRARTLACELVGADATSKPVVHPMRWAGTLHRKNPEAPRQVRIIEANGDAEITLEDALSELEGMAVLRGVEADAGISCPAGDRPAADADLLQACAAILTNPLPPRVAGADGSDGQPRGSWADWNRIGMAFWAASGGSAAGFAAFDTWSKKNEEKYDAEGTRARWQHFATSPPSRLTAATLVYEARRIDPGFRVCRTAQQRGDGPDAAEGEEGCPAPALGDSLFDLSHDGLALDLGEEWADEARHVALWGRWLFWTSAKWEQDERLLHLTRARAYLRRRADSLVRAASAGEIEGLDTEKAEAIAKTLRSAQTVAHVVGLARSNPGQAASVGQWDNDPWLLGTPGGTVDLRTGLVRPADPGDYITKLTAVAPAPPSARAPLWQAFLERIFRHDPELIGFMQRVLGYGLTGLTTEHKLIFAWGQGGNGKGVLFNTVSRIVLNYAAIAPPDLLLATTSDRHPTDLAMLRGARFVTAQELAPGRAWDEPKLKSLTGGDPITARFMRQDFFTYEPQFLLVAVGNHKPSFKGVDEAIRRRVELVPFLQNIPAAERDKDLPEKLKPEWPAILRWMIDGCLEWQRQGLSPPRSVREASEEYLSAEDVLGQWLEERCVISHTVEFTQASVLYTDWKEWAGNGGLPIGSAKAFSQRLSERGFAATRRKDSRGFVGLGLRARWEPEAPHADPGDGCDGSPHIGRNARAGAHARAHTQTPHMGEPVTSVTDPPGLDAGEVEL